MILVFAFGLIGGLAMDGYVAGVLGIVAGCMAGFAFAIWVIYLLDLWEWDELDEGPRSVQAFEGSSEKVIMFVRGWDRSGRSWTFGFEDEDEFKAFIGKVGGSLKIEESGRLGIYAGEEARCYFNDMCKRFSANKSEETNELDSSFAAAVLRDLFGKGAK